MKALATATFVLFAGCLVASGNGSAEAAQFLIVPNSYWSSIMPEDPIPVSSLPPGLWTKARSWFDARGARDSVRVYRHDLNRDGTSEYFIDTGLGGTGGPHLVIFTIVGDEWRQIAEFQGIVHLIRSDQEWIPLVAHSRGGPEDFYKFRMEFKGDSYRKVEASRFSNGKITEEKIEPGATDNPDDAQRLREDH